MIEPSTGARLIILCGLPGSGKTTRGKQIEARLGAIRLAPDEWMEALGSNLWDEAARARIEALQWDMARALLLRGLTVVIEWGTWARSERDALRIGARNLGAAVELHHLAATPEVLFERIRRRAQEEPRIEFADVLRWSEAFQTPTRDEMALFDPPAIQDLDPEPGAPDT